MTSIFPSRSDVRNQGITLAMCLVALCAVNLSSPGLVDRAGLLKGTDFVHFYVLGSVALHGPPSALYDHRALAALSSTLVPESKGVAYLPIYGPQVALFFAPLAEFPYAWALGVWVSITALIYGVCCFAFWKRCPTLRTDGSIVAILAAASPAFFNLLAYGQNSAIALACFTVSFFALRSNRPFLAGIAIGTLVYKPQLALVLACVFVLALEWKIVAGALIGAGLQLGAAWLYYGTEVMKAYWHAVRGVAGISPLLDARPYQMHSLLAFWKLLVPWANVAIALYLVTAVITVLVAFRVWRARAPLSLRFSFLLLATVLVSPHLNVYDLVILAPALLMSVDWTLCHLQNPLAKPLQRMVYFSYVLPLVGWATEFTRIQTSVIAMSAMSGMIALAVLRHSRDSVPVEYRNSIRMASA